MNHNRDNTDNTDDTDRLADVLAEHVDGENPEYDPEAPYPRVGTGKSARHAEIMAAVSDHDDIEPEWVDPKAGTERGGSQW